MTEAPATWWWAVSLAILLWAAVEPASADRTDTQPEAAAASADLLPRPVLDTGLLKSHRKDDAWLKQEHYVETAAGPLLDEHLLDPILEELTRP